MPKNGKRNEADALMLEEMPVTIKNEVKLAEHNYYTSSLLQFINSAP